MRYLYLLILIFMMIGCSNKQVDTTQTQSYTDPSQDVEFYTKDVVLKAPRFVIQKEYEKYYFSVWNNSFKKDANKLNKKAVTLREVEIKTSPTDDKPQTKLTGFYDNLIHANQPILVSHYSKDRAWVYIYSSSSQGWIKSSEMVFLKDKHIKSWQDAQQVFIIKESVPIYGGSKNFLFHSKIGLKLALISEGKTNFKALAISTYKNREPMFETVTLPKKIARKTMFNLDRKSLREIMSEIQKRSYSPSALRDMFSPFGIWLPQSSKGVSAGKSIELSSLTPTQKIDLIKKRAVAFQTVLYTKEHIALYVGIYEDEIIIYHNTQKRGKTLFSTLKNGFDLQDLKTINILTR